MPHTELRFLPYLGEKKAKLLRQELDISTVEELLHYIPYRYIDRTVFHRIEDITEKLSYVQIKGQVVGLRFVESGKQRLIVKFTDGYRTIELVWFKGFSYIQNLLHLNRWYIACGRPYFFQNVPSLIHPEVESAAKKEHTQNVFGIQGIYPLTEKLKKAAFTSKKIALLIQRVLQEYETHLCETLPIPLLRNLNLLPLRTALQQVHVPDTFPLQHAALLRLKFEELFLLELSILRRRIINNPTQQGIVFGKIGDIFNDFYHSYLPFPLTNAQKNVLRQIRYDLGSGKQMNRLLQGDVGSGKTIVALMTALIAVDNQYQVCFMAPTAILAQQHYETIERLIRELPIKAALLTGTTKAAARRTMLTDLAEGNIHILIGTHALIEERVQFQKLGLVIIDEQHRFGVEQRAKLWNKNVTPPHVLVMTATPIPRTLSMTLYGDLDVSIIDELPAGRTPIITYHYYEAKRLLLFGFLRKQLEQGRQVYVVYPLVSESENLDYLDVQNGYLSIMQAFPPPTYCTVMVHGQMKPEEKEYAMRLFKEGKAHILVSTTVIEVGVDVPNASVMVIENAEKFGLSQLHQLRGRVGRGTYQSYCILVSGYKLSQDGKRRIDLMCRTNNGFEIAEEDLRMRGPGDIDGIQQSGLGINLRIANLTQDYQLIVIARREAKNILAEDPNLQKPDNEILLTTLAKYQSRDHKNFSKIG